MNDLDLRARLHGLDRQLSSPADVVSAGAAIALYRHRRRTRAGLIATLTAMVAIAVGVPTAVGTLSSSGEVAGPSVPAQSSPPPAAVPPAKTPTPETAPTVAADRAARAELQAVAASLTGPIVLTSPAEWDRWLPEGKPYPGADTADDMSTCPRLSDRLAGALGTTMSYWVGTLPQGPFGCQWATVPLSAGPQAPDYPYLASVGFVSDGSTSERLARSFYHHQGQLCPSTSAPAAGNAGYLVRCEELGGISYALVLPDTRTSGVWVLYGMAQLDAGHPAFDVLRTVVDGASAAFG